MRVNVRDRGHFFPRPLRHCVILVSFFFFFLRISCRSISLIWISRFTSPRSVKLENFFYFPRNASLKRRNAREEINFHLSVSFCFFFSSNFPAKCSPTFHRRFFRIEGGGGCTASERLESKKDMRNNARVLRGKPQLSKLRISRRIGARVFKLGLKSKRLDPPLARRHVATYSFWYQ